MPDLIFYNGSFLTMDPARPRVDAIAVRNGRILAVGEEAEIRALTERHTEQIDLAGRCLMPGIHDSHVHLGQHGLELSRLNLQQTGTLEEALDEVQAKAATLPAGEWLLGSGFAMSRWSVDTLNKEQLDRVAPNQPVYLRSQDHHSAWVNSLALKRAGIYRGTANPPSGTIVKGADGEPTGLLLEHATALVEDVIPAPSEIELAKSIREAGEDFARRGLTTVHHMAYETASSFREMALQASRDDYPVRVWACIPQEDAEHAAALGLATGQGGDRFTIGGAKFFADGALGSLTAWMLEPYSGTSETGIVVHGPEVLAERFPLVIEAGLTPVTHAIGDAANRVVLDALEEAAPLWREKGLRPRIEHVQHIHPDDMKRLAKLGAVASMQADHLSFDVKRIRELLGDRMNRAYAIKTLLGLGVPVAFGSDTPVAHPDWRRGLLAAVRRKGDDGSIFCPQECLSPDKALYAYTHGAAYVIGREARSGQLKAGFDADFTVLSHDPLMSIDGLEICGTMVAGNWTKTLDE